MGCLGKTLSAALGLIAALASPAAAGFNDLLQVICDVGRPFTTGCHLTPDNFDFPHAVAISADDKHVYVCDSLADTLSAFARAMDGTLTLVDQEIEGSGGVSTLESCRGAAVSPDGKHVYTAALLDRAVTWFARNAMTGALTFTAGDSVSSAPGGNLSGANAVVVSPDNRHVYVACRSADSVVAFSRDTTSGDLTEIADYIDGLGGIDGLDAAEGIAISPDGKHVYVASENDDAVAVFARDTNPMSATFGRLTFVEAKLDGVGGVDGLDGASRVVLDPSGANVYVATQVSTPPNDWFSVFSRNSTTGALTFLQSFKDTAVSLPGDCVGVGPTDSGIAVSPDGLFVAVSSPFDAGLVTFSRAADGTVSLVEAICDDLFVDSDDIGSIVQIAASADGKHLYTAGGPFSVLSVVDYECDSPHVDLVLSMSSVSSIVSESACRSIKVENHYDVLAAGAVTMTAPIVTFLDDVSVAGKLTVVNSVP